MQNEKENMNPLISIVVPLYNAEKYIGNTIESILGQTYKNFEVIVIDDGSRDRSVDIIKGFQDIKIFSQKNQGVGVARNRGVSEANGEYIAFLDADDLWNSEKLMKQVDVINSNPEVAAVFTRKRQINADGGILSGGMGCDIAFDTPFIPYKHLLIKGNPFCLSSALIKKEAILCVSGFIEAKMLSLDYDLWLRMAAENFLFYLISDQLTDYRVLGDSMLHGSLEKEYGAQLNIYELNKFRYTAFTSRQRKAKIYYEWADSAFYTNNSFAFSAAIKTIYYNPFYIRIYSLIVKNIVKNIIGLVKSFITL